MGEYNGHDAEDLDELAGRDAQRIAARTGLTQSQRVIERVTGEPFEQDAHTLITKSLDHLAQGWIAQLKQIRESTKQVEQMVLTACGKAQNDVNELHMLGVAVVKCEEALAQVSRQLDKLQQ